jgi:glycosyltransferase involved in cell wall biosynthesis
MITFKEQKFCLVTVPIDKRGAVPLSRLLNILKDISTEICLVSGYCGYHMFLKSKNVDSYEVKTMSHFAILNAIFIQIQISYYLIKLRKNFTSIIFFFGGESLILPLIISKFLRKESIVILTGNPTMGLDDSILIKIRNFIQRLVFKITDKIFVYSKSVILERNLKKFRKKVHIVNHHFINLEKFKINTPFNEREKIIGYVGELRELKGVMNILKAMPEMLKKEKELKFFIIGEGILEAEIQDFIIQNNLSENVKLLGWVENEELPHYLNKLKLLILASGTEGLPGVLIEGMACGTPVLITKVGAVPDVVNNEVNSFLLQKNSPQCISESVIKIFRNENLEIISNNAFYHVRNYFSYDYVLNLWRKNL